MKNKLGHIPALTDFDKYGEMDVLRIFDNNSLGSYYKFLVKYDPDYKVRLSDEKAQVIEFISKKIANGKRAHELVLLKEILKGQRDLIINMADTLHREYGLIVDRNCAENVVNIFTNEFPAGVRAQHIRIVFLSNRHIMLFQGCRRTHRCSITTPIMKPALNSWKCFPIKLFVR